MFALPSASAFVNLYRTKQTPRKEDARYQSREHSGTRTEENGMSLPRWSQQVSISLNPYPVRCFFTGCSVVTLSSTCWQRTRSAAPLFTTLRTLCEPKQQRHFQSREKSALAYNAARHPDKQAHLLGSSKVFSSRTLVAVLLRRASTAVLHAGVENACGCILKSLLTTCIEA